MQYLRDDIDYIWNLDSDEVYKTEDIEKIIDFLEKEKPTSVGIQSCTFYGGFDHYLTGFELNSDNFLRIFRVVPGSTWATHRPPTILYPHGTNIIRKHVPSDWMFNYLGVQKIYNKKEIHFVCKCIIILMFFLDRYKLKFPIIKKK